jgi:hypothetical protein
VGGVSSTPIMEIDDYEAREHTQKKQNCAVPGHAEIDRCSHQSPPILLQQKDSTICEAVSALRNRARKAF